MCGEKYTDTFHTRRYRYTIDGCVILGCGEKAMIGVLRYGIGEMDGLKAMSRVYRCEGLWEMEVTRGLEIGSDRTDRQIDRQTDDGGGGG